MMPPRPALWREPWLLKAMSLVVLVAAWQTVAVLSGPLIAPSPLATAAAVVRAGVEDDLLVAVAQTARVFAIGLVLALTAGIVAGLLTGYFSVLGALSDVALDVFLAIPVVALIPLLVAWQGLTTRTQLIVVFLCAFFPVVVSTQTGVQARSRTLRAVGRVFTANRLHEFVAVVLPSAAPAIAAGVRIGVGRATIGVFVAELFTAGSGLGVRMQYYSTYFQTDRYFAALAVFVVMALCTAAACDLSLRRWTRSQLDKAPKGD